MDDLSAEQRATLASFLEITGSAAPDAVREILQAAGWDLETAIGQLYDGGARPASSVPEEEERLLDSFPPAPAPPRRGNTGVVGLGIGYYLRAIFAMPITVLSWPAGVLYSVLGFLARLLRIRPTTLHLRPRNPFARDPSVRSDPTSAAERWLRSLEDSTGSVRYGLRFESSPVLASSSSVLAPSLSSSTSSSGLTQRRVAERNVLPDFLVCGYEEALARAKRELKVLMVVLTCEEHDDDLHFKRDVLADADLGKALSAGGILCWGGDVRERDAYQVAKTLQYFTLPFVAFIALQPRSTSALTTSATSSSSARMAVLSRLEGRAQTDSQSLIGALTNSVLPRVEAFLGRMRDEELERVRERRLRAEMDERAERAGKVDIERVLKKRQEEDDRRAALANEARATAEGQAKTAKIELLKQQSGEWRKWARVELLGDEPAEGTSGSTRISVRLGDGRRLVRRFLKTDKVDKIYVFVECELDASTPSTSTSTAAVPSKPANYVQIYDFLLLSPAPIPSKPSLSLPHEQYAGQQLVDVEGLLCPDGNLVVEGLAKRRESRGEATDDDDAEEEEEEDG